MAYRGKYQPKNPKKYSGNILNVVYRSLLERRFMVWLDKNPMVKEWSSEEVIIKYISPLDNRIHRYFPDFVVKYMNKNNEIKNLLIEIKPLSQTKAPKKTKKQKRYLNECMTWSVNSAKWEYARNWCAVNNYEFQIWTEKDVDSVSPKRKKK